jgi:DNA polymerase-1
LPIQGACADALMRALSLTHSRFLDARIRGGLICAVHDELLAEVHEDDAERARVILTETMIEAFTRTFRDAPVTNLVDVKIGRNWKETK